MLLLFLLINIIATEEYKYTISRGRQMWNGVQRALHYLDHFKLLSNKLEGYNGAISSYFPLSVSRKWSLSFYIEVVGDMGTDKDGFALYLSD